MSFKHELQSYNILTNQVFKYASVGGIDVE